MNHSLKLIKWLFLTAGFIELIVGLSHFAFPTLTLNSGGFLRLESTEIDFIVLSIVGLGINLVIFGSLTILCAVKYEKLAQVPLYLAGIQAIKYLVRIIMELIFPVSVPISFIEHPFIPVLAVLGVLCGLHTTAALIILNDRKEKQELTN